MKAALNIPFNKPYLSGNEFKYIEQAYANNKLSGDGKFSKSCQDLIKNHTNCVKALLTTSGTTALEMAAILIDTKQGDEIIMPSYTFVSTANAFVLRGGVPVFIDIRPDTLNINERLIESAITPKTKAIVVVHYAGVSCAMDEIMDIASRHKLIVIEDAAHGVMASYKNKALGSIGQLAAYSFHDTKNIISGEGGALLINVEEFIERAEIVREKGTDRSKFLRGQVDKYTWVDIGSSFLPSEINAAYLLAQLENADAITQIRLEIWNRYHSAFKELEAAKKLRRPTIPETCQHNAHMYYLLLPTMQKRDQLMQQLKQDGIVAVSHYVPLHSSIAGKKYARTHGDFAVTNDLCDRIIRLPLWVGVEKYLDYIIASVTSHVNEE